MNQVIAWFAGNRVAANLLMLMILVGGIMALPDTRKELFPNLSLDAISISTAYPGASPESVEGQVTDRLEAAIADLEGIRSMTSFSGEHGSSILLEVDYGFSVRVLIDQVKTRLDGVSGLPDDVEASRVKEISAKFEVARLVVSGDIDLRSLGALATRLREKLLEYPSVSDVEVTGLPDQEMLIELSRQTMQRYQITFSEVAAVVRASSLDLPGGSIQTSGGEVLLRGAGLRESVDDYQDLVLRAFPDGSRITLADIAKVSLKFVEDGQRIKHNGQPAVALKVNRVGQENILEISEAMHDLKDNHGMNIPQGVELSMWQDTSKYFRNRVELLTENAAIGLFLVFALLLLFMRLQLAFWVSCGIAVSFLGAFAVLPLFGGSINMVSLFAFILVLGIVVDDAIIVGENIYSKNQAGEEGLDAAINGAIEVAKPVSFAIATTIISFLPLLFLPGPSGKLILAIPLVVIATLLFSWAESLLILPAHLSDGKKPNNYKRSRMVKVQDSFDGWLNRFLKNWYQPFLEKALFWRYATLSAFVGMFVISAVLLSSGWLNTVFFPSVDVDTPSAQLKLAVGSDSKDLEIGLYKLEQSAFELKNRLAQETGQQQINDVVTQWSGDSSGMVLIELVDPAQRSFSGQQIIDRWRKLTGTVAEGARLDFTASTTKPGPDINIELSGLSVEQLKRAAEGLKEALVAFPGVYEIRDSFQQGKQEVRISLKDEARDLGVTFNEIAAQVRQAFHGMELQQIQRGSDEIKVQLRLPEAERRSLWHLENLLINSPGGNAIPLQNLAEISYGLSSSRIKHYEQRRVLNVSAYVDPGINKPKRIMNSLKKDGYLANVSQKWPGVSWSLSGQQRYRDEFTGYLKQGFTMAMLAMYVLMAILFRSYAQPILVMTAVPFGMVGALLGHLVMGVDVTLWSFVGMIAVSGVVVNDNLVLVDYVNRAREKGASLISALKAAGMARFRPIVLTSLTTFAGLLSLMFETSSSAQFLIPMAVSLAFGVLFATLISLVLVPSLYHLLHDWEHWLSNPGKSWFSFWKSSADFDLSAQMSMDQMPLNMTLESAYEAGFQAAVDGFPGGAVDRAAAHTAACPSQFASEELQAGWEAGFADGLEEGNPPVTV
ncbi:efflux RND transporter permease subunit [Pelagibaculum spongiae]|uniref:AcrB/AcrD/AcrF family protein n=1 Tax=Pelagibaculum spongiae TaxID=2080658 RepID=A0A2V1GW67_9GAMM|nr:efflux RND transporter permease subunit [Pelagibaculum spongiae]PVZ68907.1 AcrB/AcrD/AcrF family protein [Pelagibaculum spongiae]